MKFKKNNGFTGVDISIAIIILFIFISIIATLSYEFNLSSRKLQTKGEAIEIAIKEIEKIKRNGFQEVEDLNSKSEKDKNGKQLKNQLVDGKEGYYKTILVQDYNEISTRTDIKENLVKKVSVIITYQYRGVEQSVELSTIVSKLYS